MTPQKVTEDAPPSSDASITSPKTVAWRSRLAALTRETRTSISLIRTISPRAASRAMFAEISSSGGGAAAERCICKPTPWIGTPASSKS